ncbi:MAG: uracil-DNA glycosylase [Armatimonadetes bacterium]|nr:uracil-DNA glycosylase [Armatimonadota bacterium]
MPDAADADREAILSEIADEVRTCALCDLHKARTNAVPGEGPADARVMFIGEAPGREEDAQGRPFVGPAGRYLNQLLTLAGLRREQVFITNIVKCRPPANREPRPEEAAACRAYLDGQIATICPRVICLLGRPATAALLDPSATMTDIHGRTFERDGIIYVPLYHPAAALHNQRLGPVLNEDFKRLRPMFERILAE